MQHWLSRMSNAVQCHIDKMGIILHLLSLMTSNNIELNTLTANSTQFSFFHGVSVFLSCFWFPNFSRSNSFAFEIQTLTFSQKVLNQSIYGIWCFRFIFSLISFVFINAWRLVIYHSCDSQQPNSRALSTRNA